MPGLGKVEHLVADTSAFIKNVQLQELAANIVTVQGVVDEILNKRQLRNLVVLPYDLQIKDAFPEDIKFVTEFSKKSGDYPSLSATDIQVLALTYRLEKEKVGLDHLKTEPTANRVLSVAPRLDENYKGIPGFYMPPHKDKDEVHCEESSEVPGGFSTASGKSSRILEEISEDQKINRHDSDEESDTTSAEQETLQQALLEDQINRLPQFELPTIGKDDDSDDISDDDDSDEFDDSDWITPSNIDEVKQQAPFTGGDGDSVVVACITADFAMQNILKQIGLHVLSVDGRIIQQLRTFILRCYSCFKTTSVMTKVFCPHCGNKTLKRVAVSLREDGTQEIHLSSRIRITGRGKRFSLPRPQGGKHANNPILCEDQRIPYQHPSRLARTKTNPLDPDYTAGFSPFVMRDVNSRAAMLGIHGTKVKNWMRKNPNEVMKKGRKKKK